MAVSENPSPVHLPHLETFSMAAELCSFTKAGQALGMSQAAVSQRISALEKTLGTSLFDRKGTRLLLTGAGQQLYQYAQRILELHQEAYAAVTGRTAPVTGELMLAASSIPGEHLLPDVLSAFCKQYSGVRVRAAVLDSLAVLHEIEHGNVHVGLVGRKVDSPHLEFRAFAQDEMVLVVSADHPWRRRRRVSLEQFVQQPLVLRESASGSRWRLEQALAASGKSVDDLNVVAELGSNEGIKEAVLQGMGAAVLSSLAIQKELASGDLQALKIAGLSLDRTMYVVCDTRRAAPAPARIFVRFLESRFGQMA